MVKVDAIWDLLSTTMKIIRTRSVTALKIGLCRRRLSHRRQASLRLESLRALKVEQVKEVEDLPHLLNLVDPLSRDLVPRDLWKVV